MKSNESSRNSSDRWIKIRVRHQFRHQTNSDLNIHRSVRRQLTPSSRCVQPLDASEGNTTLRGLQASRVCSQINGGDRARQQTRLGQDSLPMREEAVFARHLRIGRRFKWPVLNHSFIIHSFITHSFVDHSFISHPFIIHSFISHSFSIYSFLTHMHSLIFHSFTHSQVTHS